jgi:hypothetical protein
LLIRAAAVFPEVSVPNAVRVVVLVLPRSRSCKDAERQCPEQRLSFPADVRSRFGSRDSHMSIIELCGPRDLLVPTQIARAIVDSGYSGSGHYVIGSQIPYANEIRKSLPEPNELSLFFVGSKTTPTTPHATGFESQEFMQKFLMDFMKVAQGDKSLNEYGFDSLSALNLRGILLRAGYGMPILTLHE